MRDSSPETSSETERTRTYLETVIEGLPHPLYVLNVEDYTIEYANSKAIVEEGETCYEVTHGREKPCDEGENPIQCPIADVQESSEPVIVEHTHLDGEGKERVYQVHASPVLDEEGNVVQIVESNIDITERVEYQQQLETQRNNFEVLNQVLRHDIRNDLQLVTAYMNVLAENVAEENEEVLETVQESVRHAVGLTTKARDITEVWMSDEDKTEISLKSTLESEVEESRAVSSNAVITVEEKIPDVGVLANGMLNSVFHNLLHNAIKHNDKDVPKVKVSATESDETVQVRVADNGPGVPDSQKESIFGKGEKGLDSSGTGLGLYLVKTLVNNYGGTVWVEDNEPQGAVFVVELPKATSSE